MLDLVSFGAIILLWVVGMFTGLLLQFFRLLGAVAGVFAAQALTAPAMVLWPGLLADRPVVRDLVFPVGIFLITYLVVSLIGKAFASLVHKASDHLTTVDRVFGGIAGALKGVLLVYFMVSLLIAAESMGHHPFQQLPTAGTLVGDLVRRHPFVIPAEVTTALPFDVGPLQRGFDVRSGQ